MTTTPSDYKAPGFVVGIGASAGGLEALERFFRAVPVDTGMAFVVVQHLSPDFKSMMEELIARFTSIQLKRVEGPTLLERNTIYLMPPRKDMIVEGDFLVLEDRSADQRLHLPINRFFSSLARARAGRAVAIILSGTGSDGSVGIADIHDAGGLVLAQSIQSAKFDGMPRSAIATGFVDGIGAPEDLPDMVIQRAHDPDVPLPMSIFEGKAEGGLRLIFERLLAAHSIDFSIYKPATILRRIERRFTIAQVATVEEYCERALSSQEELDALYRDLLIGVTRFFRDPEAFETLRTTILPELVAKLPPGEDLRIWVAACSTGEEAYSIGMLALDEFARQGREPAVKIFATDVARESIRTAATGSYPAEAVEMVPPHLRSAYFTEGDGEFHVVARLRRILLFSPHNLIRDVPFNRIDLVSCRNLLIYFQPTAQARALSSFHFALRLGGVLMLGPSESTGDLERDFEPIDRQWKLYRKTADIRLPLEVGLKAPKLAVDTRPPPSGDLRLARIYDQLLTEFLPPSILLNDRREALHIIGAASQFLTPPTGRVSHDILNMCDGDLRIAIASAVQNSLRSSTRVVVPHVHCLREGRPWTVDVVAQPVRDKLSSAMFVLVQFLEERQVPEQTASRPSCRVPASRCRPSSRSLRRRMRSCRRATRSCLRATRSCRARTKSCTRSMKNCIR